MVTTITAALTAWQTASEIRTVVIDGNGDRGLCAGGDIRAIYEDGRAGGTASEAYWADEYRLNALIARYPKPIVVLMDGIVVGGGVGLAAHASHRVVNETSSVGLPEVAIGFVPDVGATWLLSRTPGRLGLHLGLTADRMDAGDAIHCGFADAFVPAANRADLLTALQTMDADQALATYLIDPPPSALATQREWIDACYSADTIEAIIGHLEGVQNEAAERAAGRLRELSPTALKVTLKAIRAAAGDAALEQSLVRELRVSVRSLAGHDFLEGIRAQVVDKDRNPQWRPNRLADVTETDVDEFFLPLGDRDLVIDVHDAGANDPGANDQARSARMSGTTKTIGFIGLGNMGGFMAANLVSAGYRVLGYDLSDACNAAAAAVGVEIADSAAKAVGSADVVITMLPAGRHVLGAYLGADGLLAAAPAGTLFIDSSTIDVADARQAAAAAVAAGHRALDAPVSGGVVGATNGTLTFMVGGSPADVSDAQPILDAMGRKVVHCGGPGAGQAAKLCNNMILGVSMIAVSEAFVLGESLGLSNEALFEVSSAATGQCWALTTNCPVPGPVPTSPANRDFQAGFAVSLMAKDLGLAAAAVEAGGVGATLGLAAADIYSRLAQTDRAAEDFSTVINAIREHSTEEPAQA
jgi:3-hydroxyisobutyrate dehydrogenase